MSGINAMGLQTADINFLREIASLSYGSREGATGGKGNGGLYVAPKKLLDRKVTAAVVDKLLGRMGSQEEKTAILREAKAMAVSSQGQDTSFVLAMEQARKVANVDQQLANQGIENGQSIITVRS